MNATQEGLATAAGATAPRLPPTPELHALLAAGIRAPSAENRHALRFEPRDGQVLLRATASAAWAGQPHRELLDRLALGAVVENIALRSAAHGWALLVRWQPDPLDPSLVARLGWQRSPVRHSALDQAIESRHTHRGFYRREPLPADVRSRLADAAAAVPGARLRWLDEAGARRTALAALRIAESERFRRRELHRELFGAIDFDLGWQRGSAEGLAPASLQVEAPARAPFALLRHWPLMRAGHWLGAHHALGLRAAYLPCALAPHLALLDIDPGTPQALLEGGRALQRAWLAAATEGVALQPMAAATALVLQRPGDGWVAPKAQARLRTLLGELSPNRRALMLLRMGRARAITQTATRKPVSHYLG